MLQSAGIGVAMCNGLSMLKNKVKHITRKDNNHDGIVDYLKYLKIR
jgi:hydroxymethylpyrimidine pyrophosphatase-like HAD family hydrolase